MSQLHNQCTYYVIHKVTNWHFLRLNILFSFAVCRNKLNKWKTMHHKTDNNILRTKYDKDLAAPKIRNDILTKKNDSFIAEKCFTTILIMHITNSNDWLILISEHSRLIERPANPCCRRLCRHICVSSNTIKPTCSLYWSYTDLNIVTVSEKKVLNLVWITVWTRLVLSNLMS